MAQSDSSARDVVHAPHAPLTEYYAGEDARTGWLRTMFDRTASDYDRIETILGFGSGPWYRSEALKRAGLQPGMRVVDVGVGTGLVACQAARLTGDPALVVGIDPSPGMMQNAQVPQEVTLVEGRAERIPYPDNSFDFLSMGYALRHISDLSAAFTEFHRVLKPGGRLCILEITCPEKALPKLLLKGYMRGVVPLLAKLAARNSDTSLLWRYYWDSIEACATPLSVLRILESAGFEQVARHVELGMFSEFSAVKRA